MRDGDLIEMSRSFGSKAIRYAQGLLGLRRDDILLASFPRSGSTWIRFFLCNLISLREMGGREVDFPLLDATMVELGVDDLRRPWSHETIPRVVKTHRPYASFLARPSHKILVIRDPRDTVVSRYWYERGQSRLRFQGELPAFLRHRVFGLAAWFRHYRSWVPRADLILPYESLVESPGDGLRTLLDFLEVDVEEAIIDQALERSRFRNVRKVESSKGHSHAGRFGKDFKFARRGGTGGWREHFSTQDLDYYSRLHERFRVEVYAP